MPIDQSRLAAWEAAQKINRPILSSEEPELPLYGGGGNGPMDTQITIKDYIDARDDAVESRIAQQLDKLPTKGTIWGAVATGIGILAALLAYGGDRFDGGVTVSPTIAKMQTEQKTRDDAQDTQMKLVEQKLDLIIKQTASK